MSSVKSLHRHAATGAVYYYTRDILDRSDGSQDMTVDERNQL